MAGGGDIRIVGGNKRVKDGVADVQDRSLCVKITSGEFTVNLPVSHGGLTDLLVDDHTQYLLVSGTRAMTGALQIEETGAGSDTISIGAPAAIAASYTLTLPIDDGAAGEVLSTDGAGVLSWIAAGGGGVTDHGALTGLADDDHTQYLLADGTRSLTGSWDVGAQDIVNVADLGVGIAIPTERLHVLDTAASGDVTALVENDGLNGIAAVRMENDVQSFEWRTDGGSSDQLRLADITGGTFPIHVETGTATNTLVLDNTGNGRIGMGIAAPDVKLHVYEPSSDSKIRVQSGGASAGAQMLYRNGSSNYETGIQFTSTWAIRDAVTGTWPFLIEKGCANWLCYLDNNDRLGVLISTPKSTLDVSGSLGALVASVSASPHTAGDEHVILVDATSGAHTENLPVASGVTSRIYHIKKIDVSANAVTVDANSTETIDGALTVTLAAQYDSVMIVSNGTNWSIL